MIKSRNGILSTIVLYNLYLEQRWNGGIFKLFRIIFLQPLLNIQLYPSSFNEDALLTLKLPHPFMIIIHGDATVGNNCVIYHEVTLGCLDHKSQLAPKVCDNVYIGCKSVLLGDIKIGKGTKIGAGSIVLGNTPPDSRIIGLYKDI